MRIPVSFIVSILSSWLISGLHAQWLPIENVKLEFMQSEEAGAYLGIEYDLNTPDLSEESPAYVFIRYKKQSEENWSLLRHTFLQGPGHGIVHSAGTKKCAWWGISGLGIADLDQVEIKVRALAMARVPEGQFRMKSVPSGGHDASKSQVDPCFVPAFYIARNETTAGMYADFLNETGKDGAGWHDGKETQHAKNVENLDLSATGIGHALHAIVGHEVNVAAHLG